MKNGSRKLEEDVAAVTIRVPRAIVSDIDSERISRSVKVPRNTWILEALVEKLQRSRKSGQKQEREGCFGSDYRGGKSEEAQCAGRSAFPSYARQRQRASGGGVCWQYHDASPRIFGRVDTTAPYRRSDASRPDPSGMR